MSAEAYARYSFVSGMSWGFSGNLGFPMPENWSFTQIKEFRFSASQTDSFDLDRDVQRPHADKGVGRDGIGGTESPVSKYVQYIADLYSTAVRYDKGNPSLRVMEYLRYPRYVDLYSGWQTLIGDVDRDWIAYAEDNGPNRVTSFTDPSYGVTVHADHFGATANAFYLKGSGSGTGANRGTSAAGAATSAPSTGTGATTPTPMPPVTPSAWTGSPNSTSAPPSPSATWWRTSTAISSARP